MPPFFHCVFNTPVDVPSILVNGHTISPSVCGVPRHPSVRGWGSIIHFWKWLRISENFIVYHPNLPALFRPSRGISATTNSSTSHSSVHGFSPSPRKVRGNTAHGSFLPLPPRHKKVTKSPPPPRKLGKNYTHPPPPYGKRCCRSVWTGLCLFCCYQPSYVVSQQSWFWAFLFDKFSNFTPPLPRRHTGNCKV